MIKIASFNCNSIRARFPLLVRWLEKERPHILCLQETKVRDEEFPLDEIKQAGYDAVFKGEKSYNGVAVLYRVPVHDVLYGFDGGGNDEGSRFIRVSVNNMTVVNTYVPQGTSPDSDKFQYKLAWFGRLLDYFSRDFKPESPLVWVGDFNVAPLPIDVHDPKRLLGHVGFHPDEHRALAKVKEWGFEDVFRTHNPGGGHFTFWDYRVRDSVARGLGWRVDHIWATAPAAGGSTGSWIDTEPRLWEKPSDHTPIVAEFKDV